MAIVNMFFMPSGYVKNEKGTIKGSLNRVNLRLDTLQQELILKCLQTMLRNIAIFG